MDTITNDLLDSLTYGSEVELDSKYTLYHYIEDDLISVFETDTWTEVYAVLRNGNQITLEEL